MNRREKVRIKKLSNPKAFIDYLQTIMTFIKIWKTIIHLGKKNLIVFDNMIADMESNKKVSPVVTELFLRGRKLNILLAFIWQSYFKVPKTIRLNTTPYFIMKIPNKKELKQIASNHSSDSSFIKIRLKNHIHF